MFAENKNTKEQKKISRYLIPSEMGFGVGFGENAIEFEDGSRCNLSLFKEHWTIPPQGSYDWGLVPSEIKRNMGYPMKD